MRRWEWSGMPFGAGIGLASASLLAGCALAPGDANVAPLAPISAYSSDASLRAVPHGIWPVDAWWTLYGDKQLSALIEDGLKAAPDMRIVNARLDLAKAAIGPAQGALAPTLGASVKIDSERQSYDYLMSRAVVPKGWNDAGIATLDFNWEIDFWGKNRAALAAAKGNAAAAEAEAAAARLALSTGIAQVYGRLAALYADRGSVVSAIDVRKQTLDLMSDRFAKSLENEGALERSRAAEAAAEAQLEEIDENISLVRDQIASMIGAGPDRGLALSRPRVKGGRFVGVPADLRAELMGRRPDIVAARFSAEAAMKEIDVAKASFYPNVNLSALVGRQALGTNLLTSPAATLGSIGPAVSLPILDGGRLVAGQKTAESRYDIAVATYDKTLAEALRQVADSVVSKRQLAAQLADMNRSVVSAEKAWQVVNDRYNGGLATYLEVLAAEDALISARRAVAGMQSRAFILDIDLVRALGGGFRNLEKQS